MLPEGLLEVELADTMEGSPNELSAAYLGLIDPGCYLKVSLSCGSDLVL